MRLLKKASAFFVLSTATLFSFAQNNLVKNDAALFGQLSSAYQIGAYPGVVEYAVQLETNFPRSIFLGKACYLKGESCFALGRFSECVEAMDIALDLCGDNDLQKIKVLYRSGKALSNMGQKVQSLEKFYSLSQIFYENISPTEDFELLRLHTQSLMESGFCYEALGEYEKAALVLQNVAGYGMYLTEKEFTASMVSLFESYSRTEKYDALLKTFASIPRDSDYALSSDYGRLTLMAGDAANDAGNHKLAYNLYCQVLNGNDSSLAAIALQKAYSQASLYPKEVGQNPGVVLANVKDNLAEYGNLLSQFWTRLAIDEFYAGHKKKSYEYFLNAESSDAEKEYSSIIGLYKSALAVKNNLTVLDQYSTLIGLEPSHEYYLYYMNQYVRFYSQKGQWDKVLENTKLCLESSDPLVMFESSYWQALALFYQGKNDDSLIALNNAFAKNGIPSKDSRIWYAAKILQARLFYDAGNTKKALSIYSEFNDRKQLAEKDRIDFAKLLFAEGKLNAAYKQASLSKNPEALYIMGLSSFNKKDWSIAEKHFDRYVDQYSNAETKPKSYGYGLFYLGYAQYKSGQSAEAYSTLNDFTSHYEDHPLCWTAYIVKANAALQNGDFNNASKAASLAMEISPNDSTLQEATLLSALIYSDSNDYDRAIQTLAKACKLNSDFGVQARFMTAQIYTKKGEWNTADKFYGEIQNSFPQNPAAEESCYRRGEIFYNNSNYSTAASRFLDYQKKYPHGKFSDAATYYLGDSLAKNGQTIKAIVQYVSLIESGKKSSYSYNASKNLVELYRSQGDYDKALSLANSMKDVYGEDAVYDGLGDQISELNQLKNGEDETALRLRNEYKKAGGSAETAGRNKGTELAEYLWKNENTKNEASQIALELFSLQENNPQQESMQAAKTGFMCAQYCRLINENERSANYYLKCARFARMNKGHSLAQRAMYGAVEAFIAAGMDGDAKATYESLQKLYPDCRYAKEAKSLLEK